MIAGIQNNKNTERHPRGGKSHLAVTAAGWIAIAAVVAAAIWGLVRFFGEGDGTMKPVRAVKPKSIAEAAPDIPPTIEKPAEPEKPLRFWEVDASQTNGFTKMQMRKWEKEHRPPPGYTNNAALLRPKPKYAIFDHPCENMIAAYLTLTPGEGMIGTPVFGAKFRQDFLKSLENPIIVGEDDSPEDAQLKRDMIATKIDLKARMDEGEDICKILSDTHREVQDLARYKMTLQQEINEFKKNPEATLEDVELFVEAANKMLEDKGIAPIRLGPITKRLILRRQGL